MISETMLKQMVASGNIGKESIDAMSRLRFNFTVVDSDRSGSSEKTRNPMLKAGMPIKADLIQWRDENDLLPTLHFVACGVSFRGCHESSSFVCREYGIALIVWGTSCLPCHAMYLPI